MINRKELTLLKKGLMSFIPLPDGYKLMINGFNQYYITRGGKKKYFLTTRFVYRLCNSSRDPDKIISLTKTLIKLEILANSIKNVRNKETLLNIIKEIKEEF